MLERLRIKRNSGKTQAGARSAGRGKDTRPADASRRGGSSSRSNSIGKDAEPPQDLAPGQQPSPLRRGPTDSGEGVESAAAAGAAMSRRSAATSAATACSLPGSSHQPTQSQQDLPPPPPQQQVLLQRGPRQAPRSLSLGEPREQSFGAAGLGVPPLAAPRGDLVEQQELLRLFLDQESSRLPSRRNPAAPGDAVADSHPSARAATQAAGHGRDVRMAEYGADLQERGPGALAPTAPLYRDAPYGVPAGATGGAAGGTASGGPQSSLREDAAAMDILSRRQQQQPAQLEQPPRRRDRGEILVELAGGALEDSLLLQLAIPRGYRAADAAAGGSGGVGAGATAGGTAGRVLDLGQPPQPVGPVLNLSSRVDLSLELQLQDIYREMAMSDMAAASSPLAPRHSLFLQQQQQRPLLRSNASAPLLSDALRPLRYGARPGQQQQLPPAAALLSGHSLFTAQSTSTTPTAAAAAASLLPALPKNGGAGDLAVRLSQQPSAQQQLPVPQSQLPPGPHTALSELTAAMQLGGSGYMDVDVGPSMPVVPRAGKGLPQQSAAGFGPAPPGAGADANTGPVHLLQQQQQQQLFSSGASGMAFAQHPDGSRAGGPRSDIGTAASDPPPCAMHGGECGAASFGCGLLPGDGARGCGAANDYLYASGATSMAAIPEAGDGCTGWCSGDEVDAALDLLMEDAGSGAVYHAGSQTATLERICFKLHNVHPNELPRDLMGTMSSWLAAARAEVVQGAVRPGCTQLILDVYAHGPDPMDAEIEMVDGSEPGSTATWQPPAPPAEPPEPASGEASGADSKAVALGGKGRVLGSLLPSDSEVARLDAAAAAAGAEALPLIEEPSRARCIATSAIRGAGPSGASNGSASGVYEGSSRPGGIAESNTAHLGSYVMHGGNVRAAAAAFKKLLGPRAVQSMSVTIRHEVLSISSRDMGRHVSDVRGTLAGLDTPLLLSVTPLAVVAGLPCEIKVIGSHLAGPGRRPQMRCQGNHLNCRVVPPADGTTQQLPLFGCSSLVGQIIARTLPGSHRAEAVASCTMMDLSLEAPEAGLMMLEWEADRAAGSIAISDWLPVLSVPDAAMAQEINKHLCTDAESKSVGQELHAFLNDLGLVLDYVTRVNQRILLPISVLMTEQGPGHEADDFNFAGRQQGTAPGGMCGDSSGGGGAGGMAAVMDEHAFWLSRGGGGGEDQRVSSSSSATGGVRAGVQKALEHDSLTELMARPRLSKKHHNRVAALTPGLLAFAADSGMAAVMSWLMDFMLEHVHFGDLAAVWQAVEPVGASTTAPGLPLLHRAVRSGNAHAVRSLLNRAASHGLDCNVAQPAGPYHITPLHLAALQPLQSGMLQACGCADPAVAELWITVTDAAGRTPAMYLRRQLVLTARATGVTGSVAVRASSAQASAVVAGPMQPRSSTSGSTTAYRSWGSEDPVDAAVVAAAANAGAGMSPELTAEIQTYEVDGLRQQDAAPPLSCEGSEVDIVGGQLMGSGEADTVLGPLTDSVEDFRQRRAMRQRGMRLTDLALSEPVFRELELHDQASAALAGTAAAPSPPVAVGDAMEEVRPQCYQGGVADAAGAENSFPQQGNGRAPLQAKAPAPTPVQVGSGALWEMGWTQVTDTVTATAAQSPPPPWCREAGQAMPTPLAEAVEACTRALCSDSSLPSGAQGTDFFGDSTEDWLALRNELRSGRQQMHQQEQKGHDEQQQRQVSKQQEGQSDRGSGAWVGWLRPRESRTRAHARAGPSPSGRRQLRGNLGVLAAAVRAAVVAVAAGTRGGWGAFCNCVSAAAAGSSAGAQAVLVVAAVAAALLAAWILAFTADGARVLAA